MVPEEIVQAVCSYVSIPIIVGGGYSRSQSGRQNGGVALGASFVVVGSVFEETGWDGALIGAFASAIHCLD